ncbi:hypothetical protein N9L06_03530 [Mariniblastus sp.]|nr:hypothetical protein [Mariniblastus sp.]
MLRVSMIVRVPGMVIAVGMSVIMPVVVVIAMSMIAMVMMIIRASFCFNRLVVLSLVGGFGFFFKPWHGGSQSNG